MGSTILIRNQASSICSGSNAFNINPASRIKHLFFIILRLISHNDAERLFTTVEKNREFLREWLPWVDETNTVEDINTFIRTSLKQYANNEGPVCVIVQDNEIIGIISFHGINTKNKSGGIGYWLSKDQNGKGIMTQCCKVLVKY